MKNLVWYNKLGFYSNPFSIKASMFNNELFGNDAQIEGIVDKVSGSGMVFISGEFGTGKTSVLKKLIAGLRGRGFEGKKVIYYNCNQSDRSIDFDKLLIDAGNFFGRLFRIRKKNMVIFLDEMQDMNVKDLKNVKKYYDDGFFKLVVFVSKYDDVKFTDELTEIVGENRFRLDNMSDDEAVLMIRERIGNLKFISDEVILNIFNKDRNSRGFLKNCEDVCRFAFERGESEVLKEHVDEALC